MSYRGLSLREAIEEYLVEVHRAHPQATYMAYRSAFKLFLATITREFRIRPGVEVIGSLKNIWAERFLAFLQQRHAVETEHLYGRAVLSFYRHAATQGWTTIDIEGLEAHFEAQRRPKYYAPPLPPIEAIKQLLAYVQAAAPPAVERKPNRDHLRFLRDKAFLLTLADTGLRVSEICGLRLGQLSVNRQLLTLDPPIPLSSRAGRALHTYLNERYPLDKAQTHLSRESLPIFARHDKRAGKRILPISRWTGNNIVDFWVKQALPKTTLLELRERGQQISPQTFRHYFVVTTLAATDNPETTRRLARHVHPATTRRYVRSIREQEEESLDTDK